MLAQGTTASRHIPKWRDSFPDFHLCWAFKQIKAFFILNFYLTCDVLKPSPVFQKKKLNGIFLPVTVNNFRAFKGKWISLVWL